jgi:hypothetical protein
MSEQKDNKKYFTISARGTLIDAPIELKEYSDFIQKWFNERKSDDEICYVDVKAEDVHKILDSIRGDVLGYMGMTIPSLNENKTFLEKYKSYIESEFPFSFHSDIVIATGDKCKYIEKDSLYVPIEIIENTNLSLQICNVLIHNKYFFICFVVRTANLQCVDPEESEEKKEYCIYLFDNKQKLDENMCGVEFEGKGGYYTKITPDIIEKDHFVIDISDLKDNIVNLVFKEVDLLKSIYNV